MAALLARLGVFLSKIFRNMLGYLAANAATAVVEGGAALFIRGSVIAAWVVFLSVFMTGVSGLALKEIFNSNPLTGAGHDALVLACAAFPLHFMFGLLSAYIVFKLTVFQAARLMSGAIKFMFGG